MWLIYNDKVLKIPLYNTHWYKEFDLFHTPEELLQHIKQQIDEQQ